MKGHQQTIGKSDSWGTPAWITDALGRFDLDPCAMPTPARQIALTNYTEREDGLVQEWAGRVWLNPPFNRYERPYWMERMSRHNFGTMLIPAACETAPFAKYVWGVAKGILMLRERPYFLKPDGTRARSNSGCTICLVAYGDYDLHKLRESGLGTVLREVSQ